MRTRLLKSKISLVVIALLLFPSSLAAAQDSWTPEQREVLAAMDSLSASTAPDGAGADAYAAILAEDFSRWTTGSSLINNKQAWVDGVRSWFEDGWRVADRTQEIVEISISGDFAFTRRVVKEVYQSPNGERTESKAGLAETWIHGEETWLLLRVNADIISSQ